MECVRGERACRLKTVTFVRGEIGNHVERERGRRDNYKDTVIEKDVFIYSIVF